MAVVDTDAPVGAAPLPTRERSARATLWALVDLAGGQGMSFLVFLVLARVIGPDQYGIFAIALSLLTVLSIVQYYGFADAIVQRARIDDSFLDTVFWCDFILALCLIAIAQAAALPAARLFAAPGLEAIIRVLSLLCLLQALVTVPAALCRRALRMHVLAARTLLSYAIGGAIGVTMALRGYGVWALVLSYVAQYSVGVLVMYWRLPWRPGFAARPAALRELIGFAGHFMFSNGLKASAERLSQLIVGLFIDATGVGYYALALRILSTASTLTISPIERTALPVLSRFANDLPRFGATYRRMLLVANSVWTPVATGLGATAPSLLPALFGNRWTMAGSVLQMMCLTAPTLGLWFLNGQALAALGQPQRNTPLVLVYVALICAACSVAARFGVVATGAAWGVLSLVMVPLHLRAIRRACRLSLRPILSDWLRVTTSAGVMLALMLTITERLGTGLVPLAIGLTVGFLGYLLMLELILMPGYIGRMLCLVRDAANPDRRGAQAEAISRHDSA